jgi:DNA-binding NarL/FixJ family response regulator
MRSYATAMVAVSKSGEEAQMLRKDLGSGGLTEQEIEVVKRATEGMTTRQIAESLQLSASTVARVLRSAVEKLREGQ